MRRKSAAPDLVIARIAAPQHGVVSFRQLVEAGISPDAVLRRARTGRLHRVHQGVYAVGQPSLSNKGRWMAAVLACGEGAVLSHRSAAGLWGLLPATSGPVHVSVAGIGGRKKRRGIRIHRSRTLTRAMLRRHQNIPVTCPARTVADLARSVTAADLRKAIRQAEVLGLPLGHEHEPDTTRSELEHDFLRLCRLHHLPPPEVNVQVGPYVVDFLWRDRSLVAETDGYRYHRGRLAFEDDRARDLQLRLLGYEVVRFTYRQVRDDPAGVAAALRKILSPRVPPFRHL